MSPQMPPTAGLRVLIVDDDRAIQELYRMYLRRHHCRCEIAANGREALLILMKQNFDVLIVDLRMATMDGLVFLEEALRIWPWLAVVISSGYVTPRVREMAARLGITRVLKKSEKIDVLLENVFEAAREQRERLGVVVENNALRLIRAHMRMMTRLTQGHAEIEVLIKELTVFAAMLSDMLSAEVSGILVYPEAGRNLLLTARTPLRTSFTESVIHEMLTRFNTLSGNALSRDDILVQYEGSDQDGNGPAVPGKIASVPIIIGNTISGLLTLAAFDATPYSPNDISLLYHAANHVSSLFTALHEIHALASHDALTGVFNRLRLDEEMARSWEVCQRYDCDMGVMMLDLDKFKAVNDVYGHAAGDDVLREFADIIVDAARASDVVARYGGDEFVIVLPQIQEGSAQVLAERILQRTRKHVFCPDSLKLSLTTSIGIASTLGPSELEDGFETLLRHADDALYKAKRGGRDQICATM